MKGYTLEENHLLELIREDGRRIDVVGVCLEHDALLSLYHKGLIAPNKPLIHGRLIYWTLSP